VDIIDKISTRNDNVLYYEELNKLINFVLKNPETGRFVQDLLNEMTSFQERVRAVRRKLNRKEPLLDDLLELILHNFILRDSRVSEYFEISINDARRAMATLCDQMSSYFMLRKDDKFGWDMIIRKEWSILGIK